MMLPFPLVLLSAAAVLLVPVNGACNFNLDTSSPTYPSHFVDETGALIQPTLQSGARIITLSSGQLLSVVCEGNTLTATGAQYNSASCSTAGSSLQVGSQSLGYSSLGCVSQPKEKIVEAGTCSSSGTHIDIGWQVSPTKYTPLITICHDKTNANTLYTLDVIYGANILADDKTNTRPDFRKGNYYVGIDVATAYTQAQQTITMTEIVGSSTLANEYIDVDRSYYFARGHLSPDGDFIDAASQDASYYYINAAPQWQSFNNGNWKELEMDARNTAAARTADWDVYTGTYGILTLADVDGRQQPIYLAKDANNNNVIPVPKYFWKVVHDKAANKATAFIGINNPHIGTVTAADIFCSDVCSQVTWASWTNRFDIPKGYMFCCTASALHNVISYAPDLGSIGLLV